MTENPLWHEMPLVIVDVETTGLDPTQERVIEIGIIQMRAGEVEDRYEQLVNPGRPVPDEVVKITGITQDDVADAPAFADILDEVAKRIEGRILVAYNLDFDRAFLKEEFERNGRAWTETKYIDPLIFARHFHKNQGSKRLEAVAARMGFKLEGAHRAGADAEVTGKVLYAFAPQLPKTLNELLVLQRQWQQQQANEMAAWRNRRETVVESADLGVNIERGNALGPAYLYGDETDPVRAMFVHLPDSGTRR